MENLWEGIDSDLARTVIYSPTEYQNKGSLQIIISNI